MSEPRHFLPFLVEFFERRSVDDRSATVLGTATFTKAREGGDVDEAAPARDGRPRGAILGTQTRTAEREAPDTDDDLRRRPSIEIRSAALFGTETGTRSREYSDRDEDRPADGVSLWGASIL
jgi:hypothetical protein